jgi:hypothetical protein|tara:strand:+ start:394 stop:639 length:246 start_codon:yes stop_codon:yes gene_type:complete
MEKCNGWTNYATWRINLEILSDMEFEEQVHMVDLKDLVEELVFIDVKDCLAADYARAFIAQVNFYEIAESINEELQTNYEH